MGLAPLRVSRSAHPSKSRPMVSPERVSVLWGVVLPRRLLAAITNRERWERCWRKRVGIEPTAPGINPEPDGFEGRAGHQTRIASDRMMPASGRPGQTASLGELLGWLDRTGQHERVVKRFCSGYDVVMRRVQT